MLFCAQSVHYNNLIGVSSSKEWVLMSNQTMIIMINEILEGLTYQLDIFPPIRLVWCNTTSSDLINYCNRYRMPTKYRNIKNYSLSICCWIRLKFPSRNRLFPQVLHNPTDLCVNIQSHSIYQHSLHSLPLLLHGNAVLQSFR